MAGIHWVFCLDFGTESASTFSLNQQSTSSTRTTPRGRSWRGFSKRKVQRNGLTQYFGANIGSNGRDDVDVNVRSSRRDRFSKKEHYLRFKVVAETNVVVDGFVGWSRFAPRNAVYLLSHFHSDHYQGLNRHFNGGLIYCSQITARLVSSRLGIDQQYLRPLPLSQRIRMEHAVPPTFVTMMDANHCPGAVMALFEVHHGADRVSLHLHLGDARCEMESESLFHRSNQPLLRSLYGRIDRLYLDSTYCASKKVLPRQSDATQFIADRIESMLSVHGDLVILIGTYSIGKERILERVAKHCGCPIFIDSAKRSIFRAVYGAEDPLNGGVFTDDLSATKVRVVWMRDIAFSTMRRFKTSDSTKVVGFRPTGWASKDGNGRRGGDQHVISPRYWPKTKGPPSASSMVIYDVPYSEHSSFPELCKFISDLRPKHIVPTVNNWSRSAVQRQIRTLQKGMDSFAVTGYRYLPLVEDNGLKQTSITQFITTQKSQSESLDHDND